MRITDDKTLLAAKEALERYKTSIKNFRAKDFEARGITPKTVQAIKDGLDLDYKVLSESIANYESSTKINR